MDDVAGDEELLCWESLDEEDTRGNSDALINEIDNFTRIRTTCACCDPIKDDEYVALMVQRETALDFGTHQRFLVNDNLVKLHRPQAISWIIKARGTFGFRFQTAYLAVTCFDRFLSRRAILDNDGASLAFKILAVACVSLSAKMEEIKLPPLRDYQWEGYHMEPSYIKAMELQVLAALGWNLFSVSPFAFLPYFIIKLFNNPLPDGTLLRIYGFIFSLMQEVNLMVHRSSAIATAATMVATDQSLSRDALESRMKPIVCPYFPDIEDVFQCYELIRRLGMEDLREPNRVNTPQIWPNTLRPVNTSDHSLGTSSTTFKSRRLFFDSPDQDKGTLQYIELK